MKNKDIRNLKVYNQSQVDKWNVPAIILKGEWLRELGFDCNNKIQVNCEKDNKKYQFCRFCRLGR